MVRSGIGSDTRIGRKFLYPGIGYGGSCFPKDVKALIKTAEQNGYRMRVLQAVEEVNEKQKSILFEKLQRQDVYKRQLVDRIVPGFPRKEIAQIQKKICYADNLVVQAEIFHLWVIEAAENLSLRQLAEEFPANKAGLNVLRCV